MTVCFKRFWGSSKIDPVKEYYTTEICTRELNFEDLPCSRLCSSFWSGLIPFLTLTAARRKPGLSAVSVWHLMLWLWLWTCPACLLVLTESFLSIAGRWETALAPALVPCVPALVKVIAPAWAGSKVSREARPGELLRWECISASAGCPENPKCTSQGRASGSSLPSLQDPEEGLASPPSVRLTPSPPPQAGTLPSYKKWDTGGEQNKSTHCLLPSPLWAAEASSQEQPRALVWLEGR